MSRPKTVFAFVREWGPDKAGNWYFTMNVYDGHGNKIIATEPDLGSESMARTRLMEEFISMGWFKTSNEYFDAKAYDRFRVVMEIATVGRMKDL